jgi:ABC-type Fe3+-siderophore transport system permease subunit
MKHSRFALIASGALFGFFLAILIVGMLSSNVMLPILGFAGSMATLFPFLINLAAHLGWSDRL